MVQASTKNGYLQGQETATTDNLKAFLLILLLFHFLLFLLQLHTNPFDSCSHHCHGWYNRTNDQACGSSFCDDAFGFCLDRSLISCVKKSIFPFSKPPRTVRPPKISRPSAEDSFWPDCPVNDLGWVVCEEMDIIASSFVATDMKNIYATVIGCWKTRLEFTRCNNVFINFL